MQASQFGHFLAWWKLELRKLLPDSVRAKLRHARRRVYFQYSGDELAVSVQDTGPRQELQVLSPEQNTRLQQQQLHEMLAERELSDVARDLLLPESEVLRKEIVLPAAAEVNLAQALAFEMDRQTPFQSKDVFFDFRVLQRDKEAANLHVEFVVAVRAPVLKAIQALEAIDLAPSGLDVELDGKPAGMNLLPLDQRHRVVNKKSRANLMLAGAAVLLLFSVMAQSLWLKQHQLAELQSAIDDVREEALQVQQIRDRIKDASEAAGFLMQRRASTLPAVRVLTEVTRILPDDTYLDRLLVDASSVQMQGKSQNAQQLIELVNQSPLMSDASFRGPTRLDSQTQKEIFDISAQLTVGAPE